MANEYPTWTRDKTGVWVSPDRPGVMIFDRHCYINARPDFLYAVTVEGRGLIGEYTSWSTAEGVANSQVLD